MEVNTGNADELLRKATRHGQLLRYAFTAGCLTLAFVLYNIAFLATNHRTGGMVLQIIPFIITVSALKGLRHEQGKVKQAIKDIEAVRQQNKAITQP